MDDNWSRECVFAWFLVRVWANEGATSAVVLSGAFLVRVISKDRVANFLHAAVGEGVILLHVSIARCHVGPVDAAYRRCLVVVRD